MVIFLGSSQESNMTMFSGAFDKSVFDGKTILLKTNEENGKNTNFYIRGDMIASFLINDNIYEYVSNMGINICPYSIATGKGNYYLVAPKFKFIKKDKIVYDSILKGIYAPD